jgi:hypothetical protein
MIAARATIADLMTTRVMSWWWREGSWSPAPARA